MLKCRHKWVQRGRSKNIFCHSVSHQCVRCSTLRVTEKYKEGHPLNGRTKYRYLIPNKDGIPLYKERTIR